MYHSIVLSVTKLSVCLFLSLTFAQDSKVSIDVTTHLNWILVNPANCGTTSMGRILGGRNASLGQYPWISRIGYRKPTPQTADIVFGCGGTLINQKYVVTAAHCVRFLPPEYEVTAVRLGEYNLDTDPDCSSAQFCAEPVQDFTVTPAQIIIHENHEQPERRNDIAMIQLDHDAVFNGWVSPICLPYSTLLTKNYIGENAEMAGWGVFDLTNVRMSRILQTVSAPIIEMSPCVATFNKKFITLGDSQICVDGRHGQDSCKGDSGGPLMKVDVLNGSPKYFFMGIISFGDKNCGTEPSVCTRVASFVDWILNNLEP